MSWAPEGRETAQLVLEDGTCFRGRAFGAPARAVGEVCFNTGMAGYQEVLTDPSYAGQIVVMTAPQIGNYGVSPFDDESAAPRVAGFVVRNLSHPSHWRSVETLHEYLLRHGVPALYGVDTRALTRRLRERGAMRGVLDRSDDSESLAQAARHWEGLEGRDLVRAVTCQHAYTLEPNPEEAAADLRYASYRAAPASAQDATGLHVVLYDFGAKANIPHRLLVRGCRVTVVPAGMAAGEVLALRPHGVLLSNGPGDPQGVPYAVASARALVGRLPVFGICLGHQILGLALGAKRYKLKFGHRGVNHPVHDLLTGKVRITTQNHGFAIDAGSLPHAQVEVTEVSLNDGTLEGMRHRSLPVFSVQYHPEASPGPHDNDTLFDRFLQQAAAHAGLELSSADTALPRQGGADAAA